MSLVAYAVNSDDESDTEEEEEEQTKAITLKREATAPTITTKINSDTTDIEFDDNELKPVTKALAFTKLPPPKQQLSANSLHEEKDDEFLHKTAKQLDTKAHPVKITIPALRDFKDLNLKYKDAPLKRAATAENKSSRLLSILPRAKSEQNFAKAATVATTTASAAEQATTSLAATANKPAPISNRTISKAAFVPDSVRFGRAACNTEDVIEGHKPVKGKSLTEKRKLPVKDDSSDEDVSEDFFSLKSTTAADDLPAVNMNELHAMLAERSAKIAATADKHLQAEATDLQTTAATEEVFEATASSAAHELDADALQTLAGRRAAKRARRGEETVHIMDINSAEILPDREEWVRTALASSTGYQATGVLTDEEPAAGTRRKHQITYLAHKAKANEAELQAMWAANRQTRRATQSKYGF